MSYRPTHARPSRLARAAARSGVVASAAAVAAATAGSLAVPAGAATTSGTTPLGVTLGSQDGGSAAWSAHGDPVLALGPDSAGTSAWVTVSPASDEVPASEPTFATDNYAAGSPRWYLDLSNGAGLFSNQSGNGSGWMYNTGAGWEGYGDTYAQAVASAEQGDSSVTVKLAQIVADGDQAAGASDTITNVSYDGQVIGGGTVSFRQVANQRATVGTKFSLNDPAATTSSDQALTYKATGLPAGLSIDASTGTISGTPTVSGQYAVTVHATDVYGDGSAYQHFVLDVLSGVTYTASASTAGVVKNAWSGKYLNVAASGTAYATGTKLIQWGSGGASHEKFEYVTIRDNSGKVAGGYLEAIAPNDQAYYVTASGTGQLKLGGQVLGVSTADLGDVLSSGADMVRSGSYYAFPNDGGDVADVSGWSTANGAKVIGYSKNGGKNQQWSLP